MQGAQMMQGTHIRDPNKRGREPTRIQEARPNMREAHTRPLIGI